MTHDELMAIAKEGAAENVRAQAREFVDSLPEPDNARDAAVERVAKALEDALGAAVRAVTTDDKAVLREAAEAAIAAYKQGQVTDEKLWAEYKRGREVEIGRPQPAGYDRRSVYGAVAK